mmetsp:Transcript_48956/g.121497  ORF Transcript_48956/g.121497 Transcript_48956/m.121497 type:complete len:119 (-) Transcript_48956:1677-2033(-)
MKQGKQKVFIMKWSRRMRFQKREKHANQLRFARSIETIAVCHEWIESIQRQQQQPCGLTFKSDPSGARFAERQAAKSRTIVKGDEAHQSRDASTQFRGVGGAKACNQLKHARQQARWR